MATTPPPCPFWSGGCNKSPIQSPYLGPTPIYRTATENLPPWAIVVIAFGILLILILIATIICCLCRAGCWCCVSADDSDDCEERKKKKKFPMSNWFWHQRLERTASKRPQVLYRYPDDDADAIVAGEGCGSVAGTSGYVPRALRLTNGRPKSVRVVEEKVGFGEDGRPIYVVDGGRQPHSVIGCSTVSSSRLSHKPQLTNEYMLRGASIDAEDVCSDISYSHRPRPALVTINGNGITGHGSGEFGSGSVYGHSSYGGYGGINGVGVMGSHSASIQVTGGHASPWAPAAPVPSIYPAL